MPPKPVSHQSLKVREDLDSSSGSGEDDDSRLIGHDRDDTSVVRKQEEIAKSQQRLKSNAKQDWQYLKQTLTLANMDKRQASRGNHAIESDIEEDLDDVLELEEKVDDVIEKEEELLATHMRFIKENAQLLTKEGQLITYVQGKNRCSFDSF